jgi:hypothetical protein
VPGGSAAVFKGILTPAQSNRALTPGFLCSLPARGREGHSTRTCGPTLQTDRRQRDSAPPPGGCKGKIRVDRARLFANLCDGWPGAQPGVRCCERCPPIEAAPPAIPLKFASCNASPSSGSLSPGWPEYNYPAYAAVCVSKKLTCGSAASHSPPLAFTGRPSMGQGFDPQTGGSW